MRALSKIDRTALSVRQLFVDPRCVTCRVRAHCQRRVRAASCRTALPRREAAEISVRWSSCHSSTLLFCRRQTVRGPVPINTRRAHAAGCRRTFSDQQIGNSAAHYCCEGEKDEGPERPNRRQLAHVSGIYERVLPPVTQI